MFTKNIKSLVSLTKSGVRWFDSKENSSPVVSPVPKNEAQISYDNLADYLKWGSTDVITIHKLLKKLQDANAKQEDKNKQTVASLQSDIQWAINAENDPRYANQKNVLQKLLNELTGSQEIAQNNVEASRTDIKLDSKINQDWLIQEVIYDQPLVKNYAQRINLWSAIQFVNQQSWTDKIQSAITALKESKIINSAQLDSNPVKLDGYAFREEFKQAGTDKRRNEVRAIEADHLLDFLEWLQKLDPKKIPVILNSWLASDEKVEINKLADLIADFDDDGILESINGTDTTTWWKWLVTKFGAGDAMQTQFFSESDMKKFLDKNMPAIQIYFEGIGINKMDKESEKDYAKRLRNAITIQADMLKTGYIGENGMKNIYSSSENLAERQTIEKVLAEVKSALKGKNIAPADLQKVSEKVTDMILRTALTFGGGSINLQEISKLVSDPNNAGVFGMDYSAFLRLINRPRLKVNGSVWIGAGVTDGWFIPLAHIGVDAKVTVADRGELENLMQNIEKSDANMTATLGASLVTKLSGPAIHADLLWKDRIDQTENAWPHLRAVIDDMMQADWSLDISKINDRKMDQSLRDFIRLLNSAITEGAKNLTKPEEKQAHAVLMKNRFLNAFDLYLHNHPKLNGVGLAGITIGLVPGALGVGPVLQNVGVDRTTTRLEDAPKSIAPTAMVEPGLKPDIRSINVQSWTIDKNKQELIQKLDIDRLFNNPNVTKFLVFMTNNGGSPDYSNSFAAAMKVSDFKNILGTKAVYTTEMNTLLDEIDEKFVGDQITRGYNRAKSDPKAFAEYMQLLKRKGIKTQGVTMDNMTPELIANKSFNKQSVRNQELALLKSATGIDTAVIDKQLIDSIKTETWKLTSASEPALVLMARSRQWKWLQGVRAYTTSSYIREQLIPDTTPEQKLKTLEKALGGKVELEKLVISTLEKSKITLMQWERINFDSKPWIATVQTKEKGKITIDLSATQLSAVLYGDTTMDKNKAQAVCINAGIKIDPKITIKSELSTPTPIDVTPGAGERVSDVVFSGTPVDSILRLMVTVPQGSGVDSGKDPNGSSDAVDKGTPVVDSNASQV